MKNVLTLLLAISFLIISGCEGPEGPTGPRGKDGLDGNANVNYNTYTVNNSWTYSSSTVSYSVNLLDPNITQAIVDNGAVLVYVKIGTSAWQLLPYTIFNTSYTTRYTAVYDVGVTSVYVTDSDLTQPDNPYTKWGTHYFKIVTIASLGKYSKNDIHWDDYNEVKYKLNLKD